MSSQIPVLSVSGTPSFVVQAKLHRPRVANGLAPLLRVQQQLAHDLDRPLTLISAPAGFGKTTLLSEWLRAAPRPNAWITLDEHDRDLVTFLTYLLAAIHTLFPDACPQTTAVLGVPTLPPISAISAILNNEIDRLAETSGLAHGQRFILVLDDYHQISQQDIHQVVNDLLLRPPRPLHLVISTRHDPSLLLYTLRMRGEMVEIRTSTLRFTKCRDQDLCAERRPCSSRQRNGRSDRKAYRRLGSRLTLCRPRAQRQRQQRCCGAATVRLRSY